MDRQQRAADDKRMHLGTQHKPDRVVGGRGAPARFFRIGLAAAVSLLIAAPGRANDASGPLDWLTIVPGDARFYVEFRGLSEIRRQFQALGIWEVVRELHEREAARAGTQEWEKRSRELFGLDTEQVITELLGRRAALVAVDSVNWMGGVIIAELDGPDAVRRILDRWNVRPQIEEGSVKRYVTENGLHIAVRDSLMVLGPKGDPDSLWGRTVLLLAGQRGPNLAARSEFAALRRRVSSDYTGLIYGNWPKGDPSAFAGCRRVLAAIRTDADALSCELRGQLATPAPAATPIHPELLDLWPAQSVAVWVGSYDFSSVNPPQPGEGDSVAAILRSAIGSPVIGPAPFASDLGPEVAVVVGRDPAGKGSFQLPAIAVISPARNADTMIASFDGLIAILARYLASLAARPSERVAEVEVKKTTCEDVELHSVAIGPALARRLGMEFLSPVELCWARMDGRLVFSSSRQQAAQIVRAARGKAARIGEVVERMSGAADRRFGAVTGYSVVRGELLADMLASWHAYVVHQHPALSDPKWWQQWAEAKLEARGRLGVALEASKQIEGGAQVVEIEYTSPAVDHVQAGDVIVAAAGEPLSAERPAQDVAQRYRERGAAERFSMELLRGDERLKVEVPVTPPATLDLAGFDPIEALRQLATLTRCAESITVCRYAAGGDRIAAKVRIVWRRPTEESK